MVSSKYLTAFSDFRVPKDMPDFIPTTVYCQYLKDYANHFKLNRYIQCGHKISKVRRGFKQNGESCHDVTVDRVHDKVLNPTTLAYDFVCSGPAYTIEADAVVVCSGLHLTPSVPDIPGLLNEHVKIPGASGRDESVSVSAPINSKEIKG
jgi:dimethylaniline monooxygenase (N-oxide forming)